MKAIIRSAVRSKQQRTKVELQDFLEAQSLNHSFWYCQSCKSVFCFSGLSFSSEWKEKVNRSGGRLSTIKKTNFFVRIIDKNRDGKRLQISINNFISFFPVHFVHRFSVGYPSDLSLLLCAFKVIRTQMIILIDDLSPTLISRLYIPRTN